MKKPILQFGLFCIMIPFFMGESMAQNSEPTCNEYKSYIQDDSELTCYRECNQCAESCNERHSTPKYDVWGKRRVESDITRANRSKCKNICFYSTESCIKRKRKLKKVQEELESQAEEIQEDATTDTKYPSSPSDSIIYKWTDKDGVINITNNKDSIPREYRGQLEAQTNGKEAVVIKESDKERE